MNGERPTHPELLEYLAQYFIDDGDVDEEAAQRDHAEPRLPAQRRHEPASAAKDSGNRLYWRANRTRHDAPSRSATRCCRSSGALDSTHRRTVGAADAARRRGARSTARSAATSSTSSCSCSTSRARARSAEKRFTTNVPLQRLFFMNSDFMQQHAERLAERVADEPDDAARIAEGVSPDLRPRADGRAKSTAGVAFLDGRADASSTRSGARREGRPTAEDGAPKPDAKPTTPADRRPATAAEQRRHGRRRDDGRRHARRQAATPRPRRCCRSRPSAAT